MSTVATSTSPHAVFDVRALRDAWRIERTVANPRAYVGSHLDCADLDADAAPWHLLWACIYSHAADLRDRALKVAGQPVQGPQVGVPCGYCDRVDCWATHRVWWTAEDGGDLEVGIFCVHDVTVWVHATATNLRGPVHVEPMTAGDYAHHGVEVV